MRTRPAFARRVLYALGSVVVWLAYAGSATGTPNGQPRVWQFASSGVALRNLRSEARSDYDPVNHQPGPVYFTDCAEALRTTEAPVRDIEVAFALVSANGSRIGEVRTRTVRVSRISSRSAPLSICVEHGYAGGVAGQRLVAWVNGVVHVEANHWSAAPPLKAVTAVPQASGLDLNDAATYLPDESCTDVKNISAREITHVQLMFEYRDDAGAIVHTDALDVRKTLAAGRSLYHLCRGFSGSSDPDVFDYAQARAYGIKRWQPADITYNGRRVHMTVRVTSVGFADGSEIHEALP